MSDLTLKYVHDRKLGYGRLGVDLRVGLEAQGLTVFDGIEGDPGEHVKGVVPGATSDVLWVSVPSHSTGWLAGQRQHIFTMWEATLLPEVMRENMDHFDTILVPSMQNLELFSRYHPNVKYCPLGVDTDQWVYTPRQPNQFFYFMTAGSGRRKGSDLTVEAFGKAFKDRQSDGPIPRLLHKSPRGIEFAVPGVETVSGYISDAEEIALYERAHCYVAASRGEGFGYQPVQAMAQGIPTILTEAHGHTSFAYLGYPVSATLEKAGDFMAGDAGQWWTADVDELVDRMRYVYDNYDEAVLRARVNADKVARHFSVKAMAQRVLDILPDSLISYAGSGEWFVPNPKLYRVVTNRDYKAEVAGNVLYCVKGEEYWLSADAKRVLYDHGVLDPVCIESYIDAETGEFVDTGITAQQMKEYELKRDLPRVCPTCNQVFGSGRNASDEIFERLEREAAMR